MKDEFFPEGLIPFKGPSFDETTLPRRVATKTEFEEIAASMIAMLLEEESTLEAFVRIKNVAEILDVALARIKEEALFEVAGRSQKILGASVQIKALPKKWEYSDSVLTSLEGERAVIEQRIKERKKLLETLKQEVVDPATGEIIHPAKCIADGVTLQVLF